MLLVGYNIKTFQWLHNSIYERKIYLIINVSRQKINTFSYKPVSQYIVVICPVSNVSKERYICIRQLS